MNELTKREQVALEILKGLVHGQASHEWASSMLVPSAFKIADAFMNHSDSKQWQVHVSGPDDIHEFADEVSAHRAANEINKIYLEQRLVLKDECPLCVATVSQMENPKA